MEDGDNYQIEEDEYYAFLQRGKNSAPGYDMVSRHIFRKLSTNVHKYIIKIYNFCIKIAHFPNEWKRGMIPKANQDHHVTSSYPPITLLPVIGKNFEILIKNRIND